MATDSASAIETTATDVRNEAYITPAVDFLIVLASMCALAFVGVAVIIP